MHHRSWDHSGSSPRWEARLEDTTEDFGHMYAPMFLRREKMGECTLQDLLKLWHD